MIGVLIAAWLDVRSKPIRTLAAIAGMVAAVMAVVLVDAAATLSRDANAQYIASRFGRTATVTIRNEGGDDPNARLSPDAYAAITSSLQDNGVWRLSPAVESRVMVAGGSEPQTATAMWVSSVFPDVSNVEMTAGQWPRDTASSSVLHAVVSQPLADQIGYPGASAVGAVLWFGPAEQQDPRLVPLQPLVVDGIARSFGPVAGESNLMLVSDQARHDLLSGGTPGWIAHVNPVDVTLIEDIIANVGPMDAEGRPLYAVRRADRYDELAPLLDQQSVTARGITIIALIIGGLGILGVGLASVRERAKDFGLRRALGASKRIIFTGVIVQTLMEVLLAAMIAIPLAALTIELFARQLVLASLPLPASTALPLRSAMLGLISALLVGLLAGLLPAIRAARASVVQALRG